MMEKEYKIALIRIADALVGIPYAEMSQAEIKIMAMLVGLGFLARDPKNPETFQRTAFENL